MRTPTIAIVAALAILVVLSGCTTSLTNMAPARTMKPGEAQVATGYQFDVHSQAFTGIYDAGDQAVEDIRNTEEGETISEETLRSALDAVLMWRLFPVGGGPEFMGRAGLYDGFLEGIDAGFRYNGNVFKGDLRLQVWASDDDAAAISLQAAYGHHKALLPSVLDWLVKARFNRKDFDFQANFGYEFGHFAKLYFSPRYIVSTISPEVEFRPYLEERIPEEYMDWDVADYFPNSTMHYAGANFGAMLGYRWAFLNLDVNVFRIMYHPEILGSQRDYGGWVFAPTAAITLMWR